MIRALLLALALAAAAAVCATPAQAGIVAPEDAAELAQTLAEAQEEQDVCYGWAVTNNFDSSPDVGNSRTGPGQPLIEFAGTCTKGIVVLTGSIDYACGSCESEDSASVSIESNLRNPPTVSDLEGLGLKAGDLTGDKDDTTLINMVNALPLLVADRGNAPYVAYEPAADVPAADHATGKPGSDFLRDAWLKLVLFGGLIASGPMFYLYKRGQTKSARRRTKRKPRPSAPAAAAEQPADPTPSDSGEPGSEPTPSDLDEQGSEPAPSDSDEQSPPPAPAT